LTVTKQWLLVEIESGSNYHKMALNFCDRNFNRVVKLKDTVLVFNSSEELRKKSQFLHWLINIYKKESSRVAVFDLKSLEKIPIKIKILNSSKSVFSSFTLNIKQYSDKEIVTIKTEPPSEVIKQFLKLFFRGCHTYKSSIFDIAFSVEAEFSQQKLRDLLKRKKLLSYNVNFKSDNFVKSFLQPKEIDRIDNAFKLLSSKKSDEFSVIKKRYLKLAKKYHPDSVFLASEETIKKHTDKFQEIQEAFSIVKEHFKK
jgi:molecular chaperone DnaJ